MKKNTKDLEISACKHFVCPNLHLIDEKCKEIGIYEDEIKNIKEFAVEYFMRTYHSPRYSGVRCLLPAFVYITMNIEREGDLKYIFLANSFKKAYSMQYCGLIFDVSIGSVSKWTKDIAKEMNIDLKY